MATISTSQTGKPDTGDIVGRVIDEGYATKKSDKTRNPVFKAEIRLYPAIPAARSDDNPMRKVFTDVEGHYAIKNVPEGDYRIECDAFFKAPVVAKPPIITVEAGECTTHNFSIGLGLRLTSHVPQPDDRSQPMASNQVTAGTPLTFRAAYAKSTDDLKPLKERWESDHGTLVRIENDDECPEIMLLTDETLGPVKVKFIVSEIGSASTFASASVNVLPAVAQTVTGRMKTTAQRTDVPPTRDLGLWAAIRNHSKAMSFGGVGVRMVGGVSVGSGYQGFIDRILCGDGRGITTAGVVEGCGEAPNPVALAREWKQRPLHGMGAYELLKTATEVFLLLNCGVSIRPTDVLNNPILNEEEEFARSGVTVDRLTQFLGTGRLPYIERIVRTAFPGQLQTDSLFCVGLTSRVDCTCLIELIWSYWHEEGMLAQTLNAISRRFQNMRSPGDRDPLAHLEIDPLRPLNSLLWGYIQDEQNRLTVKRRAYEYDHHYGLTIYGKAVPTLRPADSRSKFLEAFHNLLHRCSIFYKEDNDTTVIADGFPLLNALKEVHLLLAQGAHNQFGDLPWTARVEMMTQQWLLARPEIREFLQSRPMVPYTEAWMPLVDTMKTLQGWSDVTITHFRDLGVFGEQILLTIRYADWIDINDENSAKNWARYWRPEIQGYLHAYRAVTGVDLTNPDTVDYTMPAVHLQKRLSMQRARAR